MSDRPQNKNLKRGNPATQFHAGRGNGRGAVENGEKSGASRRLASDMRELMKISLSERVTGKDYTHAQRITDSIINIAENPKNGSAAVRAYETILHMIGQDEPEQKTDALDILAEILKENRKNAELQADTETE